MFLLDFINHLNILLVKNLINTNIVYALTMPAPQL